MDINPYLKITVGSWTFQLTDHGRRGWLVEKYAKCVGRYAISCQSYEEARCKLITEINQIVDDLNPEV